MSAFLFLPAAAGAKTSRRVAVANIASLFAEIEEPIANARSGLVARVLAFILILLFAVGDFVLITRPDGSALSSSVTAPATRPVTTI